MILATSSLFCEQITMQDLVHLASSSYSFNLYYIVVNDIHNISKFWLLVVFFLLLQVIISVLGLENLTEGEKLNLEAITKIHFHLDDDRNGKVDLSESNEVSA